MLAVGQPEAVDLEQSLATPVSSSGMMTDNVVISVARSEAFATY